MIQVLLISPHLPPDDLRFSGDHGYTQTLLEYPPDGVQYYHHETLIAQGLGRRIKPIQILVHQLCQKHLIAPGLWFESFETDFVPDIIHIVSFSALVKIRHKNQASIPVIIGTSTGSTSDLHFYHSWSEKRVQQARIVQRALLRLIGAYETALNPRNAKRVLVWSEFARSLHLEEGVTAPNMLEVLPPSILPRSIHRQQTGGGPRFLFIGRDFERKNGSLVLEAFHKIHAEYPQAEMLVVGQPANKQTIRGPGLTHYLFVPRQQLMEQIIPAADVLFLPSRAEGFGLVIVEAMACGLAVVGVDAYAMPEIIQHGQNGFLIHPDSCEDILKYMRLFAAQPDLLQSCKRESLRIFSEKFTVEIHNRRLRAIYDEVLNGATV